MILSSSLSISYGLVVASLSLELFNPSVSVSSLPSLTPSLSVSAARGLVSARDLSTIPFLLKSSIPSKTPSPSVSGLLILVPNLVSMALVKPSASGSKVELVLSIKESLVQENRLNESAAIKIKDL